MLLIICMMQTIWRLPFPFLFFFLALPRGRGSECDCRDEIQRIKTVNPDISHREAFSAAAKNVSGLFPPLPLSRIACLDLSPSVLISYIIFLVWFTRSLGFARARMYYCSLLGFSDLSKLHDIISSMRFHPDTFSKSMFMVCGGFGCCCSGRTFHTSTLDSCRITRGSRGQACYLRWWIHQNLVEMYYYISPPLIFFFI